MTSVFRGVPHSAGLTHNKGLCHPWLGRYDLLHVLFTAMDCMPFSLFRDSSTFSVIVFNLVPPSFVFCCIFHFHFDLFNSWHRLDALPVCVCVCVVTSCPVLEFELRKAKETIQALRANLTQAAGVAYFKLLPNLNLLFSFPHLFLVFLRDVSLHCCLTSCCQMF